MVQIIGSLRKIWISDRNFDLWRGGEGGLGRGGGSLRRCGDVAQLGGVGVAAWRGGVVLRRRPLFKQHEFLIA